MKAGELQVFLELIFWQSTPLRKVADSIIPINGKATGIAANKNENIITIFKIEILYSERFHNNLNKIEMISRYSRQEMTKIWKTENKYQIWFEIEAYIVEALEKLGEVPSGNSKQIWKNGKFSFCHPLATYF